MKVIIYANCQGRGIDYFLRKFFKKNKIRFSMEHVVSHMITFHKTPLNYNSFSQCDLFIYQPIEKKHGRYSTDKNEPLSVVNFLPNYCKQIAIPYVHNDSLWSLFPNRDNIDNKESILKYKQDGVSLSEMLQMYDNFEIDFNYKERSERTTSILLEKERLCDIKISNFLKKHMQDQKLFITQNHPTSIVFIELVEKIINMLGYDFNFEKTKYSFNESKLECHWPQNKYDLNYWSFFYSQPEPIYDFDFVNDPDEWTKDLIKKIYNKF